MANQESNSTLTLPFVRPPVDQIATDLGPTPYLSNVTNELRNLRTYSAPSTDILEFTQAMSPQTRGKSSSSGQSGRDLEMASRRGFRLW